MFGVLRTQHRVVGQTAQVLYRHLATQPSPLPPSSNEAKGKNNANDVGEEKAADLPSNDAAPPHADSLDSDPIPTPAPHPTTLSLDFSPDSAHVRPPAIQSDQQQQQQQRQGPAPAQGRTGATSAHGAKSSLEQQRGNFLRRFTIMLGLGTVGAAVYIGREWDAEELRVRKWTEETAPKSRWGRMSARFLDTTGVFTQPIYPELLPSKSLLPYNKPYTLVLSLDDLLVTSTWDRQNGWRTAKRPGVDYFIAYLSQWFEVVVFTSQPLFTATPILAALDPYEYFIPMPLRLAREHTRSSPTGVVKDLSYLNRDLSKVIMIDTDGSHITHPENAIILPKWKGDPRDKGLIAMIPFLESIGIYKPEDLRKTIAAFAGKDIPTAYAKVEAETKERYLEDVKKRGGGLRLGSLIGTSSSRSSTPLSYLEEKRHEAQYHYQQEQKWLIAEYKPLFEEDKKRMEEEMAATAPSTVANWFGAMLGGPQPGVSDAQAQAQLGAPASGMGTGIGATPGAQTK